MGQIRKRGGIWWVRYHSNGRWQDESSGSGERGMAERLLQRRELRATVRVSRRYQRAAGAASSRIRWKSPRCSLRSAPSFAATSCWPTIRPWR